MSMRPSGYFSSTFSTNHGTAGVHDAVVLGQHYAELGVVADRVAHHLFVALFEDVQRQMRSGEDHDLQREQRDEPRRHGTIMAFQWNWPSAIELSPHSIWN